VRRAPPRTVWGWLSSYPLLKIFKHTFYSYDLGKLKREPETFSEVLDAISLPPRSCLFVDDNPVNVAAAKSVNISSIRFVNAEQLTTELERRLVAT
jgi:HAD superfamily hydrolase (TIGR01509 family)